MSMTVYGGNRLEGLAAHLATIMESKRPEDPFQSIPVVIHSTGMARWLRQEIAKSANGGISANIDFIFPGKFFQKWVFEPMERLAGRKDVSGLEKTAFDQESIKWLILKTLHDGMEKSPDFEGIRTYIGEGSDADIRRYQISARIARLFDRYMSYRPEMLRSWEQGRCKAGEEWQKELWNGIMRADCTAKPYSSHLWNFLLHPNPSEILEDISELPAVYIFGLTGMPPAHLAMLQKISGAVPVHFFWMNPCKELWDKVISRKLALKEIEKMKSAEIFGRCQGLSKELESLVLEEAGNPLLGSLGRVGRDLHTLLMNCENIEEAKYQKSESSGGSGLILEKMQEDILHNVWPEAKETEKIRMIPGDRSISIHNCYGPLREAEALHEFLIRAFDKDSTLLPRDIIVYVPDLEEYAPAIESVFGGMSPYSSRAIPFTVADRTLTHEYPACAAFSAILDLMEGRFRSSDIISIWSFQEIRDRAGVSDEDWDDLQRLLAGSRVGWGIDEIFREKTGGCRFRQNSWRFAIDRLIYGAVMTAGQGNQMSACFRPRAEGNEEMPVAPLESAEPYPRLIGLLAGWLESIFEIHDEISRNAARKSGEWMDLMERISDTFLPSPESDDGSLAITRTLGSIRGRLEASGLLDMESSWKLVSLWVREMMQEASGEEKFCCGMLTFCRFQPMRGIPARIVCMLGMNDNSFPRQDRKLGFDLMDPKARHLCDRWGKDDDRYCFLEALLSARDKIFLSYSGRRDTDKQEMPPSILVEELVSYLASRVDMDRKTLENTITVRHPLHPFSPAYFAPGDGETPQSSSGTWCAIAEKLYSNRQGGGKTAKEPKEKMTAPEAGGSEEAEAPRLAISIEELVKFFESPCKHYYENIVGIDLEIYGGDRTPLDEEPMGLDNLQTFKIRNSIYEAHKLGNSCSKDELYARKRAEGELPFGTSGLEIFTSIWDETSEWIDKLRELEDQSGEKLEPESGSIEMEIDGAKVELTFELDSLRSKLQLLARPSELKAKDVLQLACMHAVVQILRQKGRETLPAKSVFLPIGKRKNLDSFPDPESYLRELIRIYIQGQRRPICFWLNAAYKAMENGSFDYAKAKEKWDPSYKKEGVKYSLPDPYTVKAFGKKMPDGENLMELMKFAETLFRLESPDNGDSNENSGQSGEPAATPQKRGGRGKKGKDVE